MKTRSVSTVKFVMRLFLIFGRLHDQRLKTQRFHWDRGRPARTKRRQARKRRNLFNSARDLLLALRARGGRDARAPSEELERLRGY
jgi:hypothetical protein